MKHLEFWILDLRFQISDLRWAAASVAVGNRQVNQAVPRCFRRFLLGFSQQVERRKAFQSSLSALANSEDFLEGVAMVLFGSPAPPADRLHSGVVSRFCHDRDLERTRLH